MSNDITKHSLRTSADPGFVPDQFELHPTLFKEPHSITQRLPYEKLYV